MEKRTLSKQVYEHLKEEILSHRLTPGERLREVSLAERLHISRAPIREALQALAVEGLVTIYPRRGAIVAVLSPEEFLEFVQVREALEALAVRLAVPQISQDDLETLYRLQKRMGVEGQNENIDEYFRLNAQFHALFVERSGNQFLQDMYAQLMDHLKRYRLKSLMLRRGIDNSKSEHEAILNAVKRSKPDEAAHLMAEHIRVPREAIERETIEQPIDAWTSHNHGTLTQSK